MFLCIPSTGVSAGERERRQPTRSVLVEGEGRLSAGRRPFCVVGPTSPISVNGERRIAFGTVVRSVYTTLYGRYYNSSWGSLPCTRLSPLRTPTPPNPPPPTSPHPTRLAERLVTGECRKSHVLRIAVRNGTDEDRAYAARSQSVRLI